MSHTKEIWKPEESGMYILACDPDGIHGYVAVEIRGWGRLSKLGDIEAVKIQKDRARRLVALWNAAEELGLTTEQVEDGIIQMTFIDGRARLQECISEKKEAQRAAGRLKDQYENVSKHYSRRGGDIERLEAEKSEMVVALKTMVEMVEMNGFGKHYALDLARAAIRREEK